MKEKDKIEIAIKNLKGFQIGYKKAIEDVEKMIDDIVNDKDRFPRNSLELFDKFQVIDIFTEFKQQLQELKKENK